MAKLSIKCERRTNVFPDIHAFKNLTSHGHFLRKLLQEMVWQREVIHDKDDMGSRKQGTQHRREGNDSRRRRKKKQENRVSTALK